MPYTIVLRHSNRRIITKKEDHKKAGLTLLGRLNALRAGAFIKQKFGDFDEICSSNIKRCYTTACMMKIGIGDANIPIIRENPYGVITAGYVKEGMVGQWIEWFIKNGYRVSGMYYTERFREWHNFGIVRYGELAAYWQEFSNAYLLDNKNRIIIGHDVTVGPLIEHLSSVYRFNLTDNMVKPSYLSGFALLYKELSIHKIWWIEACIDIKQLMER